MKNINKVIAIIMLMMCVIFLSFTKCTNLGYYQMNNFSDEQTIYIKSAFGISNEIDVKLESLITQFTLREPGAQLLFTIKTEDIDNFSNNLPFKEEWDPKIADMFSDTIIVVFNEKSYYLSKTGGIKFRIREYLPVDGKGVALYSCLYVNYDENLYEMAEEFGTEADGFLYCEGDYSWQII